MPCSTEAGLHGMEIGQVGCGMGAADIGGGVSQLEEEAASEPVGCGFESHHPHWASGPETPREALL